MNRHPLIGISALALALLPAAPAQAVLLNFELTGSRNAIFQLDSNPIPTSFSESALIGDQARFDNVAGNFNGAPGTASQISFGTSLIAALNINGTSLGFTQFTGPALFSGPASSPVFATGTFTLNSIVSGRSTLTISEAVVAAVPEPASWAMMIAGFGLVGAAMRRKAAQIVPG